MKLTREKKVEFSKMLVNKVKNLKLPVKPTRTKPLILVDKKSKSVSVTLDFSLTAKSKEGFYLLKKQDFKSVNLDNSSNIVRVTDTFTY